MAEIRTFMKLLCDRCHREYEAVGRDVQEVIESKREQICPDCKKDSEDEE